MPLLDAARQLGDLVIDGTTLLHEVADLLVRVLMLERQRVVRTEPLERDTADAGEEFALADERGAHDLVVLVEE